MQTALDDQNELDDKRWQAVLARNSTSLDPFLYGVTTTSIVCRPNCPSRRPKRENVRFFADLQVAEQAGFRACKRCQPEVEATGYKAQIEAACRLIEAAEDEPALSELAANVGLSPAYFQRLFKAHLGLSPKQFAKTMRASRLRNLLGAKSSVTSAIYEAGYQTSSRAYEAARDNLGMTPSARRKGGAGLLIRYAVARSALGPIIVAGTARGICMIEFGEDEVALIAKLEAQFPEADLAPADSEFSGWLELVLQFIARPAQGLDLPLDIQGTAFQERVWRALQDIEPGTTLSYGELAARLGDPKAARAVAGACAANRIAVAIPCHRIISATGASGGYRWGKERKQALLQREASA